MLNKLINKKNKNSESGFTIIEVLIVLAIAGLILVVVLIAIPQLQRNQRNTARQNDAARVATSVSNWVANNNGAIPTSAAEAAIVADIGDLSQYVLNIVPADGDVTFSISSVSAAANTDIETLEVQTGAKCNTNTGGGVPEAGTARQFVVLYALETSGTATNPACLDV